MTAEKVRTIAAAAFQDGIDIRMIIETLEAGNTPAAVAAVNATNTGKVVKCIYRCMWTRLVMIVARAYAKETRDGDLHVQYAFDLLKEPAVRSAVEQQGDATALSEAIKLWAKCRHDHRLQTVLTFRDKQLAHWGEMTKPSPIINDIFAVSRATAVVLEKLANGAGVVFLTLDSQLMLYQEQAKCFWAT
jgi:hypothetical protein